jgi:hypothetical protein
VGEKWMPINGYDGTTDQSSPGFTTGDNQSMYTGYEWDNHRVAWNPESDASQASFQPSQDASSDSPAGIERRFGSAHPATFQMVFCDGSVHSIAYEIDPATHRKLANRFDGEAVPAGGW